MIRSKARRDDLDEKYVIFSEMRHEVVCSFEVIEKSGKEISPNPGTMYVYYGDEPTDQSTHDVDQADCFLRGDVKWDGCSNWEFPGQETCMLHFCGRKDAESIGRLMSKLYEIAVECMPKHRKYLLDGDVT